jgi:hypothetical protein
MSKRLQNAFLAVVASVLLAPAPAAGRDAAYPRAAIVTPASAGGSIEVVLQPGERGDAIDPAKLAEAFLVYAERAGPGAPMAGVYAIEDGHIRFTPRFPLRPGVTYGVSFDGDCLFDAPDAECRAGPKTDASFTIAANALAPPAQVAMIEPRADALPANLLRFYIHFTAPMAQIENIYDHVSLVRGDGSVVDSPFLNLSWNLWDDAQQRLTVLLDPGRIKRGVGPNLEVGPPLVEGRTYTLRIGPGLRDAQGRPLAATLDKTFTVTAPVRERLDPLGWTIETPPSGSREPLRVLTPVRVDSGNFARSIAIIGPDGLRVIGAAELVPNALEWRFVPKVAWLRGRYGIVVRSDLEDVSGNSVQSALDALAGRAIAHREENVTVPFEVSAP